MRLAVILPHTKLYGGVKRFMELGNIFVKKGHEFIIFSEKGEGPSWYDFKGEMATFNDIESYELDAIFFTETKYVNLILSANSKRKIFYFVRPTDKLNRFLQHKEIEVFANSTNNYNVARRKFKIDPFKALGGINTKIFTPKKVESKQADEPFVIMSFGRITERRKGTKVVVKACERLYKKGYNIKLLLFDSPVDVKARKAIEEFDTPVPHEYILNHPVMKNNELYSKADIYVAAEHKTGYSNTSVEAMATGIPVIATKSGTNDFLFHEETGILVKRNRYSIGKAITKLMNDEQLRIRYAEAGRKKIEEFDWEVLADRIEKHLTM